MDWLLCVALFSLVGIVLHRLTKASFNVKFRKGLLLALQDLHTIVTKDEPALKECLPGIQIKPEGLRNIPVQAAIQLGLEDALSGVIQVAGKFSELNEQLLAAKRAMNCTQLYVQTLIQKLEKEERDATL